MPISARDGAAHDGVNAGSQISGHVSGQAVASSWLCGTGQRRTTDWPTLSSSPGTPHLAEWCYPSLFLSCCLVCGLSEDGAESRPRLCPAEAPETSPSFAPGFSDRRSRNPGRPHRCSLSIATRAGDKPVAHTIAVIATSGLRTERMPAEVDNRHGEHPDDGMHRDTSGPGVSTGEGRFGPLRLPHTRPRRSQSNPLWQRGRQTPAVARWLRQRSCATAAWITGPHVRAQLASVPSALVSPLGRTRRSGHPDLDRCARPNAPGPQST